MTLQNVIKTFDQEIPKYLCSFKRVNGSKLSRIKKQAKNFLKAIILILGKKNIYILYIQKHKCLFGICFSHTFYNNMPCLKETYVKDHIKNVYQIFLLMFKQEESLL